MNKKEMQSYIENLRRDIEELNSAVGVTGYYFDHGNLRKRVSDLEIKSIGTGGLSDLWGIDIGRRLKTVENKLDAIEKFFNIEYKKIIQEGKYVKIDSRAKVKS